MKKKNLGIDKFRGEIVYGDIYVQTVIRQGYMREVEICSLERTVLKKIMLPNQTAVQKMIEELQKIIKNWA